MEHFLLFIASCATATFCMMGLILLNLSIRCAIAKDTVNALTCSFLLTICLSAIIIMFQLMALL